MSSSPHPERTREREALHVACRALRDELARLVADRDHLLHVVAPNLEAEYRLLLGAAQLELLEVECAVRRLRRMLELVRAAAAREVAANLAEIERRLDAEMLAWQARLAAERRALSAAVAHVEAEVLTDAEGRELHALYRQLAKRLHPDVNPAGGEATRALWLRAATAYRAANLPEMRATSLLADARSDDVDDVPALAGDALRERHDALRVAIAAHRAAIDAAMGRFPLDLMDRLADPAWVAARQAELAARRDELADQRQLLEAALAHLLPEATR